MILALAGGVGGARLANGLVAVLPDDQLTIVVNTGDDSEHLGLSISPDLDTVCYTLAGINNLDQGWGIANESWSLMGAIERLGGDTWFRLGDQDVATHLMRTMMLRDAPLSAVTSFIAGRLGINHRIVPMSDDPVRSMIETDQGVLAFQDYFVRHPAEPRFLSIRLEGVECAKPSPALLDGLENPDLQAVIICPSNPVLSITPILAVGGVRERLMASSAPVVAVSPFIDGRAVKGPAAKIMIELGRATTTEGVIEYYDGLLDGILVHSEESRGLTAEGVAVWSCNTLMASDADQQRLARESLAFASSLR
ncbi:2-phospho-L-lactate transferase [Sphingobium lactosutens]|uniref:2-phospho-L-lactate transferase n=1 Tax=Sphingobium lactosutens TaxID=522773 RepID=UPI0015B9D5A9|nr:2-phospho-L-lactate transferase [Sphingobium lactosutens]NWK94443.1 2-phospho-L-lactate transferase [Sphingobium lactosutens]